MDDGQSVLCPSARCKEGSQLLGVRQDDGTVAILPTPLPIDAGFIQTVSASKLKPEQRFRFTNKCVKDGCRQWNGEGCSVADRVIQYLDKVDASSSLPKCSIRPQCRWFLQRGGDACKMCVFVITEITEEEVAQVAQRET